MKNFWHTLPRPILALAPMAGYTDSAWRLLCKEFGADVVYSEMISADAICRQNKKTLAMLKFDPRECPALFQLFGSKPESFTQAVKIINKNLRITNCGLRVAAGLDINLGCPAHKVYKTGAGAALMNKLDLAYGIIKTVCANTDLPVSIKIRTKVKNTTAIDFVKKIKNLPFSAIMVHGRSLSQGFSGPIDFTMIKHIKQLLPDKIVLANGGINTPEDIAKILKLTQADGVGIGRGALGRPWIFESLKHKSIKALKQKTNPAIGSTMLKHAKLFLQANPNLIPLRKHLVHYVKGLTNASALRQEIIKTKTIYELTAVIQKSKY